MSRLVTRNILNEYLIRLSQAYDEPGTVYLIGETSQVFESWRTWTLKIEIARDVPSDGRFDSVQADIASELDVHVINEFPGDLIPLPDGYAQRSPAASSFGSLEVRHFDPYSTAFRFIARGDERDYHLVLAYVKHGWIDLDEMDDRLEALLPRFSTETIQQDPAEFRRKYKGLMQMSRSIKPGTTHRHPQA